MCYDIQDECVGVVFKMKYGDYKKKCTSSLNSQFNRRILFPMIVSLHSVDIILRKDSDQPSFSHHFLSATSGPMQIVVNVVNSSGPLLFR